MRITILGSGGGESYPAAFCSCEHCETARRLGGKNIRTLSQTLIDDDLLIDFPADTSIHCAQNGINLGKISNILITHPHMDHYYPNLANLRRKPYAHALKYEYLNIYGPGVLKKMYDCSVDLFSDSSGEEKVHFVPMEGRQTETIGEYSVTALKANHALDLGALNYLIEKNNKRLLYLLDTGYPTQDTFDYLRSMNKHIDCLMMDCTMGNGSWVHHMGFAENKKLKQEMLSMGIVSETTKFVITHITHNHCGSHEEIEKEFQSTGILVAYDGMKLEV